jgi:thiamine biosynthesis lipoprotein
VFLTTTEHRTRAADGWRLRLFGAVALVVPGVIGGCTDHRPATGLEDVGRIRMAVERELMGTRFCIDVVVRDTNLGERAIEAAYAEIERSEGLLSNWDDHSQISEVNRSAGIQPVTVGDELLTVLQRAIEIAKLTDGAFDITFASCGGLWSIREERIPTDREIATCLPHVDYRQVALDAARSAVYIADPDMRLGIAGLAKGYRVDRAAEVLESRGVTDYVVDGGGDMRIATGNLKDEWPIKVAHPRRETPLGIVELASGAIATSGDYEWYFEKNGVRYHHILDPATGRPARRCLSATVIAANAVEADALATGLFVLGPDDGLELAERLPGVEAMLIGPDLTVRKTAGFPSLTAIEEAGP